MKMFFPGAARFSRRPLFFTRSLFTESFLQPCRGSVNNTFMAPVFNNQELDAQPCTSLGSVLGPCYPTAKTSPELPVRHGRVSGRRAERFFAFCRRTQREGA